MTEEPSLITRLGKITRLRLVSATRGRPLRTETRDQLRADRVDLRLRGLAVERNPLGDRPAAEIDVVGGEVAVAELDRLAAGRQHQALPSGGSILTPELAMKFSQVECVDGR